MLANAKVEEIVQSAVTKRTPAQALELVLAQSSIDSGGEAGLRVTLVFRNLQDAELDGNQALDLLVDVHDRLLEAGEERFPILQYTTEKDLKLADKPD
jgi:hypothetical protein